MEHLTEDNNIRVKDDCDLFGLPLKAGHKIICISKQGNFNGLKMRVPPPEFEALMFFTALESAAKAEVLKKVVVVEKSSFDCVFQSNYPLIPNGLAHSIASTSPLLNRSIDLPDITRR